MKPLAKTLLPILAVLLLAGCLKDKVSRTYTLLTPVYKYKSEVLAAVKPSAARALENPGKIYIYGQYLFVNEVNKGVHIIDNSNPSLPVNKAFINIPGNVDIAVKGNVLYADIYTDLLTIDITSPLAAKVTNVTDEVFPERNYGYGISDSKTKYIVDWVRRDTTVPYDAPPQCINCGFLSFDNIQSFSTSAAAKATIGIAGSMSRFAIVNSYMYAVGISSLKVFNIDEVTKPVYQKEVNMQFGIETVYPFADKLFIGSQIGMFVFDISNAANPTYVSGVSHMRSCDPVVTDGDYAYVTLRAGTTCGGSVDSRLEVLDVKQITQPKLLATYSLSSPYGLGKDGNLLWICDGTAGLKMYDASNPASIVLKKTFTDLEAFDVIPYNGKLIVSAKEGIIQYDYSTPGQMKELSRLKKK